MTKGEQARLTAWRRRVLQQAVAAGNVARICRRFGVSRKSFYKWKKRHAEHGDSAIGRVDVIASRANHNEAPASRASGRSPTAGRL